MPTMRRAMRHTMLGAMTLALAACSSTPVATPPAATSTAPPMALPAAPAGQAATASPAPGATVKTVTLPPHLDPDSSLSKARSVYFGFDETALPAAARSQIAQHGQYLASQPGLAIRIEGNTDERGSAEYNLALGQKRAQAVLLALKVYGVRDSQLEAVSWGEEKPRAAGHSETAWAENRRADLQYPLK